MEGLPLDKGRLLEYVPLLVMDMDLRIVFWSLADEQVYGFTHDEAVGRTARELLHTAYPCPLEEIKATLMKTDRWQGELVHTLRDGRKISVASSWTLYRAADGTPSAIAEINNDISKRRQVERQLAENLSNMEYLTETATGLLESMPFKDLFEYTADRLQKVAGLATVAVSEYNSETNETILRALAGPADKLARAGAILGRDPIGIRFKVTEGTRERMKRGRLFFVEGGFCDLTFYQLPEALCKKIEEEVHAGDVFAMPFFLGEDFLGTVAVITDRDEGLRNRWLLEAIVNQSALALKRKQAERALRQSEARFRATFDNAAMGMVVVNEEGTVVEANPAFAAFVGYDLGKLPGTNVRQYAYPPDLTHGDALLQEMIEGKRESYQVEKRYVTAEGKVVWGRLTASIARGQAPGPLFIVGMVEDITGRKHAEESERKRKQEQLEFYRRTILAATEGKLLITEKDEIYREAGEPIASWEIVDPEKLSLIRHEAIEIGREAGIDEGRLEMFAIAVGEALTNTIKHAGGGKATLHRGEDCLMLIVEDHGPGIPSLALPEVALTKGYSTMGTLGMGYKFMITFCDMVYLATGGGGTVVGLKLLLRPSEKVLPEISPLGAMLAMEEHEKI